MIRVSLAITALLALMVGSSSTGWAADPLKIGFISSFSTPTSTVGPDVYDGFTLALKELNNKLGGRDVDLIKGDDQFKPDVAVQLARKMIDEDKVKLITGIVPSNNMLAVAHTALPRKVFILSTNAGPSQLAGKECSPIYFRPRARTTPRRRRWGYISSLGVKDVFLMAPNYPAGKDMLAGFKRGFKGNIVDEIYTPLGNSICHRAGRAPRRQARRRLLFLLCGAASINFVKQFAEAGLKEGFRSPRWPARRGDAARDGRRGGGHGARGLLDLRSRQPAEQGLRRRFHQEVSPPAEPLTAEGYDTARLLDAALKRSAADRASRRVSRRDGGRLQLRSRRFRLWRTTTRCRTIISPR